jgi:hypothetical protein
MRGIQLAHDMIQGGRLPLLDRMTNSSERFPHTRIREAIEKASSADSLKVIIDWE